MRFLAGDAGHDPKQVVSGNCFQIDRNSRDLRFTSFSDGSSNSSGVKTWLFSLCGSRPGDADCESNLVVAGGNIPIQRGNHVCCIITHFSITLAVPVASKQVLFGTCGS